MVLVGVLASEKQIEQLRLLRVRDSKLISPKRREFLASQIRKIVKGFHISKVLPSEIDEMILQKINLNKIEAQKAAEIINNLIGKVKTEIEVIIDCPSPNTRAWHNYLMKYVSKPDKIKLRCEHKADARYVVVGAASILAKVARDQEIERIKERTGCEFGSLPFNEEVLIEHNGKIKIEKIGPLVENAPWKINAFGLAPNTFKIKKFKVTNFVEHPKTRIYELILERGKKVRLSLNHPIFVLNSKGEVVIKNLQDIKIGEQVAVAGNIHSNLSLSHINLIKYLKDLSSKKSPLYVKGKQIEEILNKERKKLVKLCEINRYSKTAIQGWQNKKAIPLHIFKALGFKVDLNSCYLCSREEKTKLPVLFKITKEFMWFLGMFIAEGWVADYNTCISSQDTSVLERIKKFVKKYGLNPYFSKDWVGFSSILFVKLIRSLGIGNKAQNKKIPEFVFSCDKDNIQAFLDGLYEGDGWIKDKNWEIELTSPKLIKQIQWLNLLLNKFCSNKIRKDRNRYLARILSKSTNSLSPDNIPSVIGPYLKYLRESKNLSRKQLADRIGTVQEVLNTIENQKVSVVWKKTLEKFISVIPDGRIKALINSDLCWLRVKKINYIGKDKVYDLGIEGAENFIGGDVGIVLHNSGYPSDPLCQQFLKTNKAKELARQGLVRRSWATWRNEENRKSQRKLGDY